MWIKNLYIEDFGCFRHQRLTDIGSELNIFGGPQRAGKTTLMLLLRYLGYKFPREKGVLPPPNDTSQGYKVDADLMYDSDTYLISRRGYSNPLVSTGNGTPQRNPYQLYGELSNFRYRQLFTISLDELSRLPSGVEKDQQKRLQVALLGAGWADVVKMPRIARQFGSRAEDIGGKRGAPSYQLKPHIEKIQEGVEQRKKANKQLEEHRELKDKKREIQEKITEHKTALKGLRSRRDCLYAVQDLYNTFRYYRELRSELSQEENKKLLKSYPDNGLERGNELKDNLARADERYQKAVIAWEKQVEVGHPAKYRNKLLENSSQIEKYERELSGLRQGVNDFTEKEEEWNDEKREFQHSAGEIKREWREQPELMKKVKTGLLDRDKLYRAVNEFQGHRENYEEHDRKAKELNDERESVQENLEEIGKYTLGWWVAFTVFFLVSLLVSGVLAFGFSATVWIALMGITGAGLIFTSVVVTRTWPKQQERARLDHEIERKKNDLKDLENRVKKIEKDFKTAKEEFQRIVEILSLPGEVQPETVKDFYQEVKKLQGSWQSLIDRKERLEKKRKSLNKRLLVLSNTLKTVGKIDPSLDDVIDQSGQLFNAMRSCLQELELAKELSSAQTEKRKILMRMVKLINQSVEYSISDGQDLLEIEEEIRKKLGKFISEGECYNELVDKQSEFDRKRERILGRLDNHATREHFKPYKEELESKHWIIGAFTNLFEKFSSVDVVEEEIERIKGRITEVKETKEKLENKLKSQVKSRLNELSTDEKLVAAHKKVEEGRKGLRPLAERYAVLRIAQKITERFYEQFMEESHGSLLVEASKILSRITGGDYTEIRPAEDLTEAGFKTLRAQEDDQETFELSRGTREQLFLSVRLARIKDIKPPLPLVLDDPAVNFDPNHRDRVIEILGELGDTHQQFILTSHPEMVQCLADTGKRPNTRFWTIDQKHCIEGPFDYPDPIMDLL